MEKRERERKEKNGVQMRPTTAEAALVVIITNKNSDGGSAAGGGGGTVTDCTRCLLLRKMKNTDKVMRHR